MNILCNFNHRHHHINIIIALNAVIELYPSSRCYAMLAWSLIGILTVVRAQWSPTKRGRKKHTTRRLSRGKQVHGRPVSTSCDEGIYHNRYEEKNHAEYDVCSLQSITGVRKFATVLSIVCVVLITGAASHLPR